MKTCIKCSEEKSLEEFWKRDAGGHARQGRCKECRKKQKRQHYQTNRHKIIEIATRRNKQYGPTPRGRYSVYKSSAARKGNTFDLSFNEFVRYWQIPCSYCGAKIETIGLDRVDNNKGYVKGNILTCCTFCNKAKRNATPHEWYQWAERLSKKFIPKGRTEWPERLLLELSIIAETNNGDNT